MNKLLSKHTLYGIIGVFISVAIIYSISYSLIIKPMQAELQTINKNVKMYDAQLSNIEDNLETESSELTEIAAQLVPSSPQPDVILVQIEKFSVESNTTVTMIESTILEEKKETSTLPKKIKKTGYTIEASSPSLESINTFLTLLKENEPLFTIEGLTVTKTGNQQFSLLVTFVAYNQN
ncbi:hypothetical protein [Virgibacillus sp. DJP39]|uniref:hypothetical protein n=1 Tax=Virgibacillus sp. DJP39 TaxID=3409790 RepID=UPI003BB7B2EB